MDTFSGDRMTCPCGPLWRFELAGAMTGRTFGTLRVLSCELGEKLNESTTGTITCNAYDVQPADIWPHTVNVFAFYDGECVWGGLIETFNVVGLTLTIGLQTLDDYMNHRLLRDYTLFDDVSQTLIGASLVNYCRDNGGLRLVGAAADSTTTRFREYSEFDRSWVGTLISDLVGSEGGPDYIVEKTKDDHNLWTPRIVFTDKAGAETGVTIIGGIDTSDQDGITVNAADHATLVDAIGSGTGDEVQIVTAQDTETAYPQFDAAPAFRTEEENDNLQQQADGYLGANREPAALPTIVLTKHDKLIHIGDTLSIKTGVGAGRFHGKARTIGWVWRAAQGKPTERELVLVPTSVALESMGGTDNTPCDGC